MRLGRSTVRAYEGALDIRAALDEAQEQLDWGTDVDELRDAAYSLEMFAPAHPLIRKLDLKIASIRSAEIPRGGAPLPRV